MGKKIFKSFKISRGGEEFLLLTSPLSGRLGRLGRGNGEGKSGLVENGKVN